MPANSYIFEKEEEEHMKTMAGLAVCCLLAVAAIQSVEKPVKPAIQKPMAVSPDLYQQPLINNANSKCLSYTGEFDVFGKHFGASQGNRVVRINGKALPAVMIWENEFIRSSHSYEFPGGVIVHVDIFNTVKNVRVSNVFDYFVPFCIYDQEPGGVLKPKSHVTLLVKPKVGASAAGRKVVIGGTEAQAEWLGYKIKIVVPLLAHGTYNLKLVRDNKVISNVIPVDVQ